MESEAKSTKDFTHCASCNASLVFGTFFCGKCGAAQLQAMLLPGNKLGMSQVASSTTANFDPLAPDNKPWRDTAHMKNKPALPPKLTLETQRKETAPPVVPWRPTMRQMTHNKKENYELLRRKALIRKAKGLPQKNKSPANASKVEEMKSTNEINIDLEITGEGEEEMRQKVIYFKNHAFTRRGGKPRKVKPKKKEKVYDDSYRVTGEQTYVHAVAVYQADWIMTPGFTIHASLIERCRGELKDNYVTRYFLRVGATYENPEGGQIVAAYNEGRVSTASGGRYSQRGGKRGAKETDGGDGDKAEEGEALRTVESEQKDDSPQEMVILGIFQNDVGKLLTDPQQYWVDLNLIKPDEYYMASYLQASLQYVAQRVHVTPSFTLVNLVDQVSLVEPLDDNFELPTNAISNTGGLNLPAKMAVITEQDVNLFKRRHKRALLKKRLENRLAIRREMEEKEEERRKKEEEDPTFRPSTPISNATSIYVPRFESPSSKRLREAQEAELVRKNRATSSALGPPGGELNFSIDKTVAQRSVRIPVGKVYENNYVLTIARLSVNYPDPEFLLNDPLPQREPTVDDPMKDLLYANVGASEVEVHLFPLYGEKYVAPKILSFDVNSLPVLMGWGDGDSGGGGSGSGSGSGSGASPGPSSPPVGAAAAAEAMRRRLDEECRGIDDILNKGFEATAKFFKELTGLLHFYPEDLPPDRFGNVKQQLRLGITGVAVIPFTRPVDEIDSDSDSEETAGLATWDFFEEVMAEFIQPMAAGMLFDMQKQAEEERLHRLYLEAWASVAIQRVARGCICRVKKWIPRKREERRLLRERARIGATKMQSIVRLYLSRFIVRRRKQEVERLLREKGLAEEAERWAIEVAARQAAIEREEKEKQAREAAEAAAEARRKARMDFCWCHNARCHHFDSEIKDTPLHLFGRFVCRGVCEHEQDSILVKQVRQMHDDETSLEAVKATQNEDEDLDGEGPGMWRLRLGVMEALEGDGLSEGQDTLIELVDEEAPCTDVVIIGSDALCAMAEIMRKERVLMRKEQEEVEDDYLEDRGEEMAEEDKEDDEIRVLNRTMLEPTGTLRAELFRRLCYGLDISYRYDGAMVAIHDIDRVVEHYQVFYDDDHDLVIGI